MANIDGWIAPPINTPAPLWAQLFNTSFDAFDSHNHTAGKGLILNIDLIQFNDDFSCANLLNIGNCTFIGAIRYNNCSISTSPTDLWVTDGFGYQIQITSHGRLNVTTVSGAGFTGDYVAAGAEAIYTTLSNTYTFTTNGTNLANVQCFDLVNFITFNMPISATIPVVSIKCTNIINNFLPAASGTTQVIVQNESSPGMVQDFSPYLSVSTTTTIASIVAGSTVYFGLFSQNILFNDVFFTPNFVFNYLTIQVPNRRNVNTQYPAPARYGNAAYKYGVAAIGGIMNGIPIFIMPEAAPFPTVRPFQIKYTDQDNTNFTSPITNYWVNDLVLSIISFPSSAGSGEPLSPFGGNG